MKQKLISPDQWNRLSSFSKILIKTQIYYFIWSNRLELPEPIQFALKTAFFSFSLLWIMPLEPMALPTALGGGLSIALISEAI